MLHIKHSIKTILLTSALFISTSLSAAFTTHNSNNIEVTVLSWPLIFDEIDHTKINITRIQKVETALFHRLSRAPGTSFGVASPDVKLVISALGNNHMAISDVATEQSHELLCNSYPTFASFSPDGKLIISTHQDGTVRMWNVETLQCNKLGKGFAAEFIDDSQIAVVWNDKIIIYTDQYFRRAMQRVIPGARPWTKVFEHEE